MMKYKFIYLFLILLIIFLLVVGCNNNPSIKEDEYAILRNTYGNEILDPQTEIIESYDDSWEFYGTIHTMHINNNEFSKTTTDISMKSPLLKAKMEDNINANILYRIEISCAYWEMNYSWIEKLPKEQQENVFNHSYKAFMAYHDAQLLPTLTQIIFIDEADINRPLKIIGLWTKDEILYFEAECNVIFDGLEDYISIHLTTK